MANNKLFNEFPPISTSEWEEVIQKDLKGADYEKKLIWKTLEGFKVRPYYRGEDLEGKEYLDIHPGEFPFTRGTKTNTNSWEIRQDIEVDNLKSANEYALNLLDRGVTALGFGVNCKKGTCKISSADELADLLKDIYIDCIGLYLKSGHNTPDIIRYLSQVAEKRNIDKNKITGATCYDPLGYLTVKGAWGANEESDFNTLKDTISYAEGNLPNFRVLSVNGQHFNNAGTSAVQELAYSLAMASEYISRLTEKELHATSVVKHLQLNLGVGTNYFMEIAKIRAARFLFARLFEAFGSETTKVNINSMTSGFNSTIYDPYVNVLRATSEAMAAVIGGTDVLVVLPFDKAFKESGRFSDRLSRNIQIILKEESYLDKIVDPSAGSYYIENITDSLIGESWKLFLEIEDAGGYLSALQKGIIQKAVKETANTRSKNIATRREILVGTNQYPNFNESASKTIDKKVIYNSMPVIEGNIVEPIQQFRVAEELENLRIETEKRAQKPKVFMLTIGNPAMRKARAAFSCNFFACAGYEVIDNLGFESAEEGVKAALEESSDIVVVCSSDDEYADIVPQVHEQIKEKAILVVAGAPACMDELKEKGVEHFISIKSNLLETLQMFHSKLGMI